MPTTFISTKKLCALAFVAAFIALLSGATPAEKRKAQPPANASHNPAEIHFADITQAAGIRFVHNNGAFGKKYLATMIMTVMTTSLLPLSDRAISFTTTAMARSPM